MLSPKKSFISLITLTSILASMAPALAVAKAPLAARPNCFNLTLKQIEEQKIIESGTSTSAVASSKPSRKRTRFIRSKKLPQAAENISIGVTIVNNGAAYYLSTVAPGSAADQAGLLPGDEITQVNGLDVGRRYSISGLLDALNGPEGSSVKIEIARSSDGGFIKKTLVRKKPISFPDVETSIDRDGIGYVRIRALTPAVANTVRTWFASDAVAKAKGIVLDLRTNPVGDITSLVSILSNVMAKGTALGTVQSNSTSVPLKTLESTRPEINIVALLTQGGLFGAITRYAFTIKTDPAIKILVEGESRGKNAIVTNGESFAGLTAKEPPTLYCADSGTFTWDLVYKNDILVKPATGKDAVFDKAKMLLLQ